MTLLVTLAILADAEPLSPQAFAELAQRCAPTAPLATLRSIVAVESGFRPYALSLNYPEGAGLRLGMGQGSVVLSRQPVSLKQAVQWTRWLVANGQTVSVGLMQLNLEHLAAYRLSLETAFDPCTNLRLGWGIFGDKYRQASAVLGKGQLAVHAALSAYNTGNLLGGFANGYVESVLERQEPEPAAVIEPPEDAPAPPSTADPAAVEEKPPEPAGKSDTTRLPWDVKRATVPWINLSGAKGAVIEKVN